MLKKVKTAYLAEKLKTQNLGAGGGGAWRTRAYKDSIERLIH